MDVYLQLTNIWSQLEKRWLSQPNDCKTQLYNFTDKLKFGVHVTETEPLHLFWELTECTKSYL